MTRTSCLDPRHWSVHVMNRPHVPFPRSGMWTPCSLLLPSAGLGTGLVTFGLVVEVECVPLVGWVLGQTPPGSVDCISTNSGRRDRERGQLDWHDYISGDMQDRSSSSLGICWQMTGALHVNQDENMVLFLGHRPSASISPINQLFRAMLVVGWVLLIIWGKSVGRPIFRV